jgi:hypothetical protein
MSMTMEQVGEALAAIARHDHRNLGDTPKDRAQMIYDWHAMIGHNDFGDVMNAIIEHRKESTVWLVPAHLNGTCKRWREARAEKLAHEALVPPNREKFPTLSRQVQHMLETSWNDPVMYAVAESKLNEELHEQGFPPVYDTFRGLSPVGSGIDESRRRHS